MQNINILVRLNIIHSFM